MAASPVVITDAHPATKAKALAAGNAGGAVAFVVAAVFSVIHAHDVGFNPTSATVDAAITIVSAIAGYIVPRAATWWAKNETSAEREIIADVYPVIKQGLPAIFTLLQQVGAKLEPTIVTNTVTVPAPAPTLDVQGVAHLIATDLGPLGDAAAPIVISRLTAALAALGV